MTIASYLNVSGLIVSALAAGLMFYYPPDTPRYTKDGAGVVNWVSNSTEQGKRIGARQRLFSRFALLLLAAGFILQLIATLL